MTAGHHVKLLTHFRNERGGGDEKILGFFDAIYDIEEVKNFYRKLSGFKKYKEQFEQFEVFITDYSNISKNIYVVWNMSKASDSSYSGAWLEPFVGAFGEEFSAIKCVERIKYKNNLDEYLIEKYILNEMEWIYGF